MQLDSLHDTNQVRQSYLNSHKKPLALAVMLSGLFAITPFTGAHAALSATTANTIQGTKPYITFSGVAATNLDELLSFDIPDGSGGTTTITPTLSTPINADGSWTFNQFTTKVTADGVAKNASTIAGVAYGDDDNDPPHATSPVLGTLTATWRYQVPNGSGGMTTKTLTATELTGSFDACNAPYTLTLESNGVKAQSGYGDPIDNSYADTTKVYTVNVNDYKICFAKPNQMNTHPGMTWLGWNGSSWSWNSGSPNASASGGNGGGYSSDFDPVRGFKASAPTKFPTTGFIGAEFDLVMSKAQSDYTYQSSQPTQVSVDAAGHVKFNSKPTGSGSVTITATPTNPSYPAVTYTFNPTNTWAVPKAGTYRWDTNAAQSQCGVAANVLTRQELTNSSRNTAPMGWSHVLNYYTRAVGGGVFGEWGWSYGGTSNTYPGSQWAGAWYWAQDVHTTGTYQFLASSFNGHVYYDWTAYSIHVACRG